MFSRISTWAKQQITSDRYTDDEQFEANRAKRKAEADKRWTDGHEVVSGSIRSADEREIVLEEILRMLRRARRDYKYYKIGFSNDGYVREKAYLREGWEKLLPLYRTSSVEVAKNMEKLLIAECKRERPPGFLRFRKQVLMNINPGGNGRSSDSGSQVVYVTLSNREPNKMGTRYGNLSFEKE